MSRRDDEFVHNLNRLLADPTIIPVWDSRTTDTQASTSTPGASTSQTLAAPYVTLLLSSSRDLNPRPLALAMQPRHSPQGQHPSNLRVSAHSLLRWAPTPAPIQVRSFVSLFPPAQLTTLPDDDLSLTDVLTPSNLLPLFSSHPELLSSLFPHLPSELLPHGNTPLTPQQTAQLTETLQRTINSPPFRAGVVQLDRALRTGALGGFVRSLGLPESAGTGIVAFLRAIGEQASREGQGGSRQEDRMQED